MTNVISVIKAFHDGSGFAVTRESAKRASSWNIRGKREALVFS
jgi:hypothetical protein